MSSIILIAASLAVTFPASTFVAAPPVECSKSRLLSETIISNPQPCTGDVTSNHFRSVPVDADWNGTGSGADAEMPVPPVRFRTTTRVEVHAASDSLSSGEAIEMISAQKIEAAAGTFGDPSRFLQLLPGVVSDNDQRNDFLVRGGNPSENLFVIDGIVVPTINHLALSDTTGGFVSMIDNDAVDSLTFHSGVHDAKFADRLSSVIEIATVPSYESSRRTQLHRSLELGISGVGVVVSTPIQESGKSEPLGSVLIAVRQSVLNLLTNDIGMNGVPIYNNSIVRADRTTGPNDRLWGFSLTGMDSIAVRPAANDAWETNPFDIDYHGWRNTTGINWQHTLTARTFSTLTISNAEQTQSIQQFDQLLDEAETYSERTHEGTTAATLAIATQPRSWLLVTGGIDQSATRLNFDIAQPVQVPNPYSVTTSDAQSTTVVDRFTTGSTAGFGEVTLSLPQQFRLAAGIRSSYWSLGGNEAFTPRASVSFPVVHRSVSVGYADYAQMPAFLYLVAFPQNHVMSPIRARHATFDTQLVQTTRVRLQIGGYAKYYSRYPVSALFPQLSMANVADTFGQSFLMFPMSSTGRGRVAGVEASLDTEPLPRIVLTANLTYARAWYSGLDGILRRANADIPLTANISGQIRLKKAVRLAVRYTAASGRPYTPDDQQASLNQDRDVYDLTRLNALRSARYSRLDLRLEGEHPIREGKLSWNLGLLNVLGTQNFYAYNWEPRAAQPSEQDQLPRFPEGSLKYSF